MILKKFALMAATMSLALLGAAASAYPSKPIRLIVPFSPGGGTDILARQLAENLAKAQGWNIVVENRPGGMGAIALGTLAGSSPDGHAIILAVRENMVIGPLLRDGKSTFDPTKDFTAIASIADTPQVVVTGSNSQFASMQGVIDYARSNPNTVRIGSSGPGSVAHLLAATLDQAAKIELTHVPYQGANPAISDVIGGHVELVGASIASGKSFIDGGRVRALAVSSLQRVKSLPDVPTIAELGYPGFDVGSWYAIFGPKNMPKAVVDQLNAAINKTVSTPEFEKLLEDQGMTRVVGTPEALNDKFQQDFKGLSAQIKNLKM